jgi:hypothetical protein
VYINSSFFFIDGWCTILQFIIHFSTHLLDIWVVPSFLAIAIEAVVYICVPVFVWTHDFIYLGVE